MTEWQADLLSALDDDALDDTALFGRIERLARELGFDHCAYGIRVPWPVTRPRLFMLNNYPAGWQRRYEEAGYLLTDPTVRHCATSRTPITWNDAVFSGVPQLWAEARAHGLSVGLAQSSADWHGVAGMLTLARGHDRLRSTELEAVRPGFAWLVQMAHLAFARRLVPQLAGRPSSPLTPRELEALRWTADGKTAGEIGDILNVSAHTVVFHLQNAIRKLGSTNKTAAVVKAALLGLL
jgi:DNA-binding CsgD family transcriptional regulator